MNRSRRDFAATLARLAVGLPALSTVAAFRASGAPVTAPKRVVFVRSCYGVKQANWALTNGQPFDVNSAKTNDPSFGPQAVQRATDGTDAYELNLGSLRTTSRLIEETSLKALKSQLNVIRGLDVMSAFHLHNSFSASTASLLDNSNANESDHSAFTYSFDFVLEKKVAAVAARPVPVLRVCPMANQGGSSDVMLTGFSLHPDVGVPVSGHDAGTWLRAPYVTTIHHTFLTVFGGVGAGPGPVDAGTPVPAGPSSAAVVQAAVIRRAQALQRHRSLSAAQTASACSNSLISSPTFGCRRWPGRPAPSPVVSCTDVASFDVKNDLGAAGNHDATISLVVQALACQRTNVVCLNYAGSDDVIPGAGAWHDITHGAAGDAFKYEAFVAERVAKLVTQLQGTTDVDGRTLLDNTVVVWVGELGDHNGHTCLDLPVMTFGGSNLGLRTGLLLDYRKRNPANTSGEGPLWYAHYYSLGNQSQQERRAFGRPYNDLLVTLFRALGVSPATYHAANLDSKYGSVGAFGRPDVGFGEYGYPVSTSLDLRPSGDDAALMAKVYRAALPSDGPLPGLLSS